MTFAGCRGWRSQRFVQGGDGTGRRRFRQQRDVRVDRQGRERLELAELALTSRKGVAGGVSRVGVTVELECQAVVLEKN